MTPKSEWLQQVDVDQAGDAILAEGTLTLENVTAYQVGQRLDRSSNATLYRMFYDWRARRQAEATPISDTIDVPPEVEANIRAMFDRHNNEGIENCLTAVRAVGGNLDRVMTMRIVVAERRAEKAEAEKAEVLEIGEKADNDLRAATDRIAELEGLVANGQRREDRLTGRIEQLNADLADRHQVRDRVDATASDKPAGAGRMDEASEASGGSLQVPLTKNDNQLPLPSMSAKVDRQEAQDAS